MIQHIIIFAVLMLLFPNLGIVATKDIETTNSLKEYIKMIEHFEDIINANNMDNSDKLRTNNYFRMGSPKYNDFNIKLKKPNSHKTDALFEDCVDKFDYCSKKVKELESNGRNKVQQYKSKITELEKKLEKLEKPREKIEELEMTINKLNKEIKSQKNEIKDYKIKLTTNNRTTVNIANVNNRTTNINENIVNNNNCFKCERELQVCQNKEILNRDTCNTNLLTCQENVTNYKTALMDCNIYEKECNTSLTTCETNAIDAKNTYQSTLLDCQQNTTDAITTINNCNTDLTTCQTESLNNADLFNKCNSELEDCKKISTFATNIVDSCNENATKLMASTDACSDILNNLNLEVSPSGRAYYYHNDPNSLLTWYGAQEFCRSKGMELASANTASQASYIKGKTMTLLGSSSSSVPPFYWTGLNNLDNQAVWVWQGIGVPLNTAINYMIWGQNTFPANVKINRCAGINANTVKTVNWKTELCSKQGRFICELLEPCRGLLYDRN